MSFPTYPAYKDSGVEWLGEVPEHWSTLPAKRIFRNVRDSALPLAEQLASTQAYGVIPQKQFMERAEAKVVLALAGTDNFKDVRMDDFVISLRSFQGGIEHSAYEGCVSPAYTVLRNTCNHPFCPGYFKYLLKERSYISALQSVTTGIREGRTITYDQFGSLLLPVVPLVEQAQVSRFLDYETARIDALIAEQQRLIELLKEKRQAVISHAVTKGLNPDAPMKDSGVEWLGEVPAHWVVLAIKWRARIKSGDGISPDLIESQAQEYKPHPVIGGNGVMGFTSQANVSPPLIVIGRVGALCGNVHKIHEPAWVSDNALILDFDRRSFDINYLVHVLGARDLNEISDKSAQPLITGSKVTSQYIPCPSRHEQLAIAKFLEGALSEFDQLVFEGIKGIELLKERRSALISAAVTGKIDVRGWQPPPDTGAASTRSVG